MCSKITTLISSNFKSTLQSSLLLRHAVYTHLHACYNYVGIFLKTKEAGSKADHTPPGSTEVMNKWI
jgi:hypothetical protein